MRISELHEQQLRDDPAYAAAVREIDLAQTLADQLVEIRVKLGMTQAELAKLVKTSQAHISELESGLGNPTLDTIERVFKTLGVYVSLNVEPPSVGPGAFAGSSNVVNVEVKTAGTDANHEPDAGGPDDHVARNSRLALAA